LAVLRALKHLLQIVTLELVFCHHFVNEYWDAGQFHRARAWDRK
jgi:hypothetical protein